MQKDNNKTNPRSGSGKRQLYNLINRKVDAKEIERLLKEGLSPNACPPHCPTPLHRAVRFNRPDIAMVLLRAGCHVTTSKRVEQHHSPIITIATSLNMTEVVLTLCANPRCDLFAMDKDFHTIVHIAVLRKNYELVGRLISDFERDFMKFLSLRDGLGLTPLHLAASVGDVRMLKLLLRLDDEESRLGHRLKAEPRHTKEDSSVQGVGECMCCDCGQKVNYSKTPLSCRTCKEDVVDTENKNVSQPAFCQRCSLEMHSNCSCKINLNETPVFCKEEDKQVEKLTENCNETPVSCSCKGDNHCVEKCTENCSEIGVSCKEGGNLVAKCTENPSPLPCIGNDNGEKCFGNCTETDASCKLDAVAMKKCTEQISQPGCERHNPLISQGSKRGNVNLPDPNRPRQVEEVVNEPVLGSKETLLHLAVTKHHVEVVQLLVGCGAAVNARDMRNNTPLHVCVSSGNATHRSLSVARILLSAGADWSLKGTYGPAAALLSLQGGVLHRQRHRAQVHAVYRQQLTAGMMAAARNKVAHLKLLAEFGARFMERDAHSGASALIHALMRGGEEAARYLLMNHQEPRSSLTWKDDAGLTALHLVSCCCRIKAGELTRLMLDRGYGVVLRPNFSRNFRLKYPNYTPVTQAIVSRQLPALQTLVQHRPQCLLDYYAHICHSPLHVTLGEIPDERCVPFIDFLLSHGCDANLVVDGQTACEYAVKTEGEDVFSVAYLRKKLGRVFFEGRGCVRRREVLALRELCMGRVRAVVRAAKGRYFEDVSSLPLPQSVVQALLFET